MWSFNLLFLAFAMILLSFDGTQAEDQPKSNGTTATKPEEKKPEDKKDKLASVKVHGRLLCDGKPISNGTIKLYEEDEWTFDDLMGTTATDAEGRFTIEGSQDEDPGNQIEPFLVILDNGTCCPKSFCAYCHYLPDVSFGELLELSENNATVDLAKDNTRCRMPTDGFVRSFLG